MLGLTSAMTGLQSAAMPIYRYRCASCGAGEEHIQSISDAPVETCKSCGGALEKLMTSAAFHLKGGGWYKDLYSSSGKDSSGGKESDSGGAKTASADSSGGATSDGSSSGGSGDSSSSGSSSSGSSSSGSKPGGSTSGGSKSGSGSAST